MPTGPYRDEALASVLQSQMPPMGWVGVYVKNVATGGEASIDGERVFPAASLYKLPIMVEAIRQVRLGHLRMDQEMTVRREHWVAGSGVLQARVGQRLSIRDLLRLLIVESDNIAAMMLLDLVGLDNVNQTMQAIGLRSTRLLDYRTPGAVNGVGPYTTTAADIGVLLDAVAGGTLVDSIASDEALRLLEGKQANSWLGAGLPWWTKVAHKWGDVPGARHDAGVVFTPRGRYVIVVLTQGIDANGSANYIRDVSRAVYTYVEPEH